MTPEQHRMELISQFIEAFTTKYDKGQALHGGELWRKDNHALALEEILDLWAYAKSAEAQRNEAVKLLRGWLDGTEDADAIVWAVRILSGDRSDNGKE